MWVLWTPHPVTHPPLGSCYFEPNLFPYHFLFLVHSTHIYLPMKMEQSVPKRRHINSRRRVITQNKAYKIVPCCNCPTTFASEPVIVTHVPLRVSCVYVYFHAPAEDIDQMAVFWFWHNVERRLTERFRAYVSPPCFCVLSLPRCKSVTPKMEAVPSSKRLRQPRMRYDVRTKNGKISTLTVLSIASIDFKCSLNCIPYFNAKNPRKSHFIWKII